MFRRFSLLSQVPTSPKIFPHQTLFNVTSTKQHEITSNVIMQNSNKWREFLLKCGDKQQSQVLPSKQQQLTAISVTNEQWSSLNQNNENNNIPPPELENWSSNDAFALIAFLSFNGHTPWALSAWRRCFVMRSHDLRAPAISTSLLCYPVLAMSHLADVVFLLKKSDDKSDIAQLLAKPELLNCCRKSLELARTLMNLFREEESELATSKKNRFSPLIEGVEMKFVARIGLFIELVFFVENNRNCDINNKSLLSLATTSSSSIEQEALKYWSQKLFVPCFSDRYSKKEPPLLREIVQSLILADSEKSMFCLEHLWRSLVPDQTTKTVEIVNAFDLTLGRILLKQLPHFSAILPREIQNKITSEQLFASADELLQFEISPFGREQQQSQKSLEEFLVQVINLLCVQLPSLTNKNIPLKQWRAVAINLSIILRLRQDKTSAAIAIDEAQVGNFLKQIKMRIASDHGHEKNLNNLVNAIGEIFPVLFQLLVEITPSSSRNVREIFVDFEKFLSWCLEKSLASSSIKIGSVKSDSALLFRCQSLFLTLCHIRQYQFRSSVPKNMFFGNESADEEAPFNQIKSKTMTNLLLRFPHQISLWTLPAIEDARFRKLFAKIIVGEFCLVHLETPSTETHEIVRMKANWMLDRLKIFVSVLDEMAGARISENSKNNSNIRKSHERPSSSSSLLHKLISDLVVEFSSTIFDDSNSSLVENRNPALQFILDIATRLQLDEFNEDTKNALERILALPQYRSHHASLQQQKSITFSQNNAESFKLDILRIVENHRGGQSSQHSHQRQSSRFHSLMDETVRNEKNSWHQALQLCLDQLTGRGENHHVIPKVRDCHDREFFLSSSTKVSSSLKILNQHYWLFLRRMISIGFQTGCWQSACGVLNTMGIFSSTISAGNFLYWRCIAVLRRTGRWEELMQLLTRRDGLLLLPDDARENDLVACSAVSSPQLLLTASVCSAIQRSGDFHHLAVAESSSVVSANRFLQHSLLKIISILRSNGFDTKSGHKMPLDNSEPLMMNSDEEVPQETKIDRTSLASLAKVFLRCDMEQQALELLIPACYMVSKKEAKIIRTVPSNVEAKQHELNSQDREFYKNANSVFRELVKRGKWPKSQWELGIRFAQHNGRDDLAASISAKYVVGF